MSANRILFALLICSALTFAAWAGQPELHTAVELDEVSNAVTAAPDGTVFVGFPRVTGVPGLKVAKIIRGKPVAFPDEG